MVPRVAPASEGQTTSARRRRDGSRAVRCAVLIGALLLGLTSGSQAGPKDDAAWRVGSPTGLHVKGLSSLRIHFKSPGIMWAYVHGTGVAQSRDGGRTWTPMMNGIAEDDLPGPRSSVRISLDPEKPKILYVVIDGRIYRSEDAGASWSSISSGALAVLSWDRLRSTHLCWEVQVDQKKSVRLLVGIRNDGEHNGGLYESTNSGKSWAELAGTQKPDSKLGHDTWLVRLDPKTDKNVTVAGRTGVWYSDDRGRAFERNDPGGEARHDIRWLSELFGKTRDLYMADARGIWRSRDAGKKWERKILRAGDALFVAVDPHQKKRTFAIFRDRGLEVSEDPTHKTWTSTGGTWGATKDNPGDPNAGYRTAIPREVVFHPRDKKTIYLTSPVTGLHVSTDSGKSFVSVSPPDDAKKETVLPALVPPMARVAVHPAMGGLHVAVDDYGRVYQSADRCETWTPVGVLGMEALDLQPGAAQHEWFAMGSRLLRSADDGRTWEVVYTPKDPENRVVALDRSTTAGAGDGTLRILLERTAEVVSSTDGGKSWTAAKAPRLPSGQTHAVDIAVDAANGNHLVIATQTVRRGPGRRDGDGGVYESWDGGATWTEITGNLRPDKEADADARDATANWNRGRIVVLDPASRLLIYGADGRGVLAREPIDPKGKKPEKPPGWVDITPPAPAKPAIAAHVNTITADKTDTLLVFHLRGDGAETSIYGATGKTLRALYDYALAAEKPKAKPEWVSWPSPGQKLTLASLCADGQLPGRLLATDRASDSGVLIFEIPGSKPAGPKKDEPKKDEPKEPEKTVVRPPEGMRAFTASADKTVRIWKVDLNQADATLSGHEGPVQCIVLTGDEQFLVTAGHDQTVRIWSAATGQPIAAVPTEALVNDLAVDDDSKFAYVALDERNAVLQIDIATRAVGKSFAGHGGAVTAVATSDDVNRVYSASSDETIRVWDTVAGSEVLQVAVGAAVEALAVAIDGSCFYAAGADKTIRAYDSAGTEIARIGPIKATVRALRISPDGATLYAASDVGVQALGASDLKPIVLHKSGAQGVSCVSISADGKWVFAGDASGRLWIWAAGAQEAFTTPVSGHGMTILDVAVTPDVTPDAAVPKDGADDGAKDTGKQAEPGDAPKSDKPSEVPGGNGAEDKPKDGANPGTKETSPAK